MMRAVKPKWEDYFTNKQLQKQSVMASERIIDSSYAKTYYVGTQFTIATCASCRQGRDQLY